MTPGDSLTHTHNPSCCRKGFPVLCSSHDVSIPVTLRSSRFFSLWESGPGTTCSYSSSWSLERGEGSHKGGIVSSTLASLLCAAHCQVSHSVHVGAKCLDSFSRPQNGTSTLTDHTTPFVALEFIGKARASPVFLYYLHLLRAVPGKRR